MEFILEKADYHIHTYYSDGTESPSDVVDIFHKKGMEIIAITDHDGVAGVPEATERAKLYGMKVVPGIEFSTRTSDGDKGLHILGYGIDIEDRELLARVEQIREWRQARNIRLIDEINDMGYPLTMDELVVREGQDFIGKPIIARTLVKKGLLEDFDQAFGDEFFGSERLRAIRKVAISSEDAVKLILGAGGTPVLAHPGEVKGIGPKESPKFYENIERIISGLVETGLEGLECHYPKHTDTDTKRFLDIADRYGLKVTKGSDFHDPALAGEER